MVVGVHAFRATEDGAAFDHLLHQLGGELCVLPRDVRRRERRPRGLSSEPSPANTAPAVCR